MKFYVKFCLEIQYSVCTSSYTAAKGIITDTLSADTVLHVEEHYENYFLKNSNNFWGSHTVLTDIQVFWNVMPCHWVNSSCCSEGIMIPQNNDT
jgi:hypothetical protein